MKFRVRVYDGSSLDRLRNMSRVTSIDSLNYYLPEGIIEVLVHPLVLFDLNDPPQCYEMLEDLSTHKIEVIDMIIGFQRVVHRAGSLARCTL